MQHLLLQNTTSEESRPASPSRSHGNCLPSVCRLLSSRQLLTSDTPFHPPKTYPIHPATLQIFPVSGSAPCHYGHPDNRWVSRCGDASLPVSVEYHRPNEWVNQHEETPPGSLIHLQQNYVPLEVFVVFLGLIQRHALHMLQSPSVMLSDWTCLRKKSVSNHWHHSSWFFNLVTSLLGLISWRAQPQPPADTWKWARQMFSVHKSLWAVLNG